MMMNLMTVLAKKVFISSKPSIVYLLCPPPCGPFSIQESAVGGLSYKVKKNPAKQDSPPAAGRASDILPFRCSAIHASATIYPCAECASSQSVHSIVMNNCPRQQRTKILCCRGHPLIPAPHPAPSSVQIRPQIQPFPDSNARPPRLPESALLRQHRASRPPQMITDTVKADRPHSQEQS